MQKEQFNIAMPPREAFKTQPTARENIINEGSVTFIMRKQELHPTKGLLLYHEGCDHPKKGFPFPEASYTNNLAKRFLIELLRIAKHHWYLLPFVRISKIVDSYCSFTMRMISPYIMKDEYMMPVARETKRFVSNLCKRLELNSSLADILSFIIQMDDAYALRLQDLMSETTREKLIKNPIKETRRLIRLSISREKGEYQASKTRLILNLSTLLLLIPRYRQAIIYGLENSDFMNFQYDEADKYWAMNNVSYRFLGLTEEERIQKMGNKPLGVKLEKV